MEIGRVTFNWQPSPWSAWVKDQEYYSFSDGEENLRGHPQRAFDPPSSPVSQHCLEKYLIHRTDVSFLNVFFLEALWEI